VRVRPEEIDSEDEGEDPTTKAKRLCVVAGPDGRTVSVLTDVTTHTTDTISSRKKSVAAMTIPATTARSFTFDHCFGPHASQAELYEMAQPLVQSVVDGFNATIFCYGVTGSGKTYSMTGTPDAPGIVPRATVELFERIQAANTSISNADRNGGEEDEGLKFLVRLTYVQLYNNDFVNLLEGTTAGGEAKDAAPATPPPPFPLSPHRYSNSSKIEVHENKEGEVYLSGPADLHVTVTTAAEALSLIAMGNQARATGSTKCNHHSSRSHTILTFHVESRILHPPSLSSSLPSSSWQVRRGKLHLIDLAGSERLSLSGAEGGRKTETQNTNSSLTVLANVLSALSRNALNERRQQQQQQEEGKEEGAKEEEDGGRGAKDDSSLAGGSPKSTSAAARGIGNMKGKYALSASYPRPIQCPSHAASPPSGLAPLPVPYRESKLTWLLKGSLGGNSMTLMITTLRPCLPYQKQTLVSLLYAARAKNIKNNVFIYTDIVKESKLNEMSAEIEGLRKRLKARAAELDRLMVREGGREGGRSWLTLSCGGKGGRENNHRRRYEQQYQQEEVGEEEEDGWRFLQQQQQQQELLNRRVEELEKFYVRERQESDSKLSTVILSHKGGQLPFQPLVLASLQLELEKQQSEISSLQSALVELQNESVASAAAAAAEKQRQRLSEEMKEVQKVVESWQAQAISTQQELVKTTDQLRALHQERLADRRQLEKARIEGQRARAQSHIMGLELAAARKGGKALEEEWRMVRVRLKAAKEDFERQASVLQEEGLGLRVRLDAAEHEVKMLRKQSGKMKKGRDGDVLRLEELLQQCENERDEALQLNREEEGKGRKLLVLQRQLEERETELELVKGACKALEKRLINSEERLQGVVREKDKEVKNLQAMQIRVVRLEEEVGEARKEAVRVARKKREEEEEEEEGLKRARRGWEEEMQGLRRQSEEEGECRLQRVVAEAESRMQHQQQEMEEISKEERKRVEAQVRAAAEEEQQAVVAREREQHLQQLQQLLEETESLRAEKKHWWDLCKEAQLALTTEQAKQQVAMEKKCGYVQQLEHLLEKNQTQLDEKQVEERRWRDLCKEIETALAAEKEERTKVEEEATKNRELLQQQLQQLQGEQQTQLQALQQAKDALTVEKEKRTQLEEVVRVAEHAAIELGRREGRREVGREVKAKVTNELESLVLFGKAGAIREVEKGGDNRDEEEEGPDLEWCVRLREGLQRRLNEVEEEQRRAEAAAVSATAEALVSVQQEAEEHLKQTKEEWQRQIGKMQARTEKEWKETLKAQQQSGRQQQEEMRQRLNEMARRNAETAATAVRAAEWAVFQEKGAAFEKERKEMEDRVMRERQRERTVSARVVQRMKLQIERVRREHDQEVREAVAGRNREWMERWDAAMIERKKELDKVRRVTEQEVDDRWQVRLREMLLEKEKYYGRKYDKLQAEARTEASQRLAELEERLRKEGKEKGRRQEEEYQEMLAEVRERVETAARQLEGADKRVNEAVQTVRKEVWEELREREREVEGLRERLLQTEYDLKCQLAIRPQDKQQQQQQQEKEKAGAGAVSYSSEARSSTNTLVPTAAAAAAASEAAAVIKARAEKEHDPRSASSAATFHSNNRPAALPPPSPTTGTLLGQMRSALLDGNALQLQKLLDEHPNLLMQTFFPVSPSESGEKQQQQQQLLLPYHLAMHGFTFHADLPRLLLTLNTLIAYDSSSSSISSSSNDRNSNDCRRRSSSSSSLLLVARDCQGDSVFHALFKHVGSASVLFPVLEKLLRGLTMVTTAAATETAGAAMPAAGTISTSTSRMNTSLTNDMDNIVWTRNAEGKTALELGVLRALASPDTLPALHRLLELVPQSCLDKRRNDASSLLSFALLQATTSRLAKKQQQQPFFSSLRARSRRTGEKEKEEGTDDVPLYLGVLAALSPIYSIGWDAGWKERGTGRCQGQLLALLAPTTEGQMWSEKAQLLYDTIVRAALRQGVLVPRVVSAQNG